MTPLRLRTLGTIDLRDASGGELRAVLSQPKRLALLAYLAISVPRGARRRDTLLAMFWPELDAARGRNALSQALHVIRRELGDDVLVGAGAEQVGVDDARLLTDVEEFRAALARGALDAAVERYGGELLPGLHVSDAPDFERWLDAERTALRGRALDAAMTLARRAREAGERGAGVAWARRATAIAPDDERALRALMSALDAVGERAEARRAYEAHATRLRLELGDEPEPATQALGEALSRAPAPAVATPLPAPVAAPRMPDAATPRARRRDLGRSLALGLLGVAGAATFLVVSAARRRAERVDAGAVAADVVSVLPFTVQGRGDIAYLREAMVMLLGTRIDELSRMRATDARATLLALRHAPDTVPSIGGARAVARALGAGRFVMGDVVAMGPRLRVVASLYDVGASEPVVVATADGDEGQLPALVDRLAAELTAGTFAGPAGRIATTASLTTTSLPALRAFLAGEAHMRGGRFFAASVAFREAAQLDTTFALAYYRAAIIADWTNLPPGELAHAALRHSARLSRRDRLLVQSYVLYMERRAYEAERGYELVTVDYPTDVEAWRLLGEVRFHYGPLGGASPERAAAAFERVLALEPANYEALLHLARLAARRRDARAFDTLAVRAVEAQPGHERNMELDAIRIAWRAAPRELEAFERRLATVKDLALVDVAAKAVLAYTARADAAARFAAVAAHQQHDPAWSTRSQALIASIEAGRGRWDAAAALLDTVALAQPALALAQRALVAAVPASPEPLARRARRDLVRDGGVLDEPRRLYLLALLDARLGDLGAADSAVARLRALAARGSDMDRRDYLRAAAASVALARGDAAEVLRMLAPSGLDVAGPTAAALQVARAPERWALASAHARLGHVDDALRWLDTFPEPGGYDAAWLGAASALRARLPARAASPAGAR